MDLYKLKTFITVAAYLNFNKAAKSLNCAQSTVSVQIKSLEDEIGELLFQRIKKRVVLTPAGEKMLGYANKLLSIEEEAIADIAGKKDSSGTIGLMVPEAVASSFFPSVISRLMVRYPTINLDISNCSETCLENDLQTGSVDLAFVFSDNINSSALNSEKILSTRLLMVANPDHPLSGKERVDDSCLQRQTIFFLKTGCGYGLPVRQLLNANVVRPSSVMDFTSVEAIKKCVMGGLGLAILPQDTVLKEIRKKQLVPLKWTSDMEIPVLMVWHKDTKKSEILLYLMELVRHLKRDRPSPVSQGFGSRPRGEPDIFY